MAAPAFAGILSLVNQKTGSRQGNANYALYSLYHQQTASGTTCDASSGNSPAGCLFNDITAGTIAQPCLFRSPNCASAYPVAAYGILSGYSSTPGYDRATGLGSVNAANLVDAWATISAATPSSTTLSLTPTTLVHGGTVTGTVQVTSALGIPTGAVSLIASAGNGVVASGNIINGTFSAPIANFPGGTYNVQAHYGGDSSFAGSDSSPVALTVTPENSATALQPQMYSPLTRITSPVSTGSIYPYGAFYFIQAAVAGLSGNGVPTGDIVLKDANFPIDGGTFRINAAGGIEDQTTALAPGTHTLVASFSGDASFRASQSAPFSLIISKAPTVSVLATALTSVAGGGTLTVSAQVFAGGVDLPLAHGYGALAPSGPLNLLAGTTVLASAPLQQSAFPAYNSDFGSVSFTIPASQLAPGTNSLSVSYGGDANYLPSSSAPVVLTITAPVGSFTLTPTAASAIVHRGIPSTLSLLATPLDGFNGSIRLACTSGLPSGAACAFSPAMLTPAGLPATTALTLTAEAALTSSHLIKTLWLPISTGTTSASLLLLCLPSRRRRSLLGLTVIVLCAGLLAATGCGGTYGIFVPTPTSSGSGTPIGNYTVTVTATAGPVVRTTTINLAIQ